MVFYTRYVLCDNFIEIHIEVRRYIFFNYVKSPDHIYTPSLVPQYPSVSKAVRYTKGKSIRKLQGEFQKLRKQYWGQHLRTRRYFISTSGQISAKDGQKRIEEQKAHHKQDNFRISECREYALLIPFPIVNYNYWLPKMPPLA